MKKRVTSENPTHIFIKIGKKIAAERVPKMFEPSHNFIVKFIGQLPCHLRIFF